MKSSTNKSVRLVLGRHPRRIIKMSDRAVSYKERENRRSISSLARILRIYVYTEESSRKRRWKRVRRRRRRRSWRNKDRLHRRGNEGDARMRRGARNAEMLRAGERGALQTLWCCFCVDETRGLNTRRGRRRRWRWRGNESVTSKAILLITDLLLHDSD